MQHGFRNPFSVGILKTTPCNWLARDHPAMCTWWRCRNPTKPPEKLEVGGPVTDPLGDPSKMNRTNTELQVLSSTPRLTTHDLLTWGNFNSWTSGSAHHLNSVHCWMHSFPRGLMAKKLWMCPPSKPLGQSLSPWYWSPWCCLGIHSCCSNLDDTQLG